MTRRRRTTSRLLLPATILALAGCGGGGEVAGGADDLPGPVPEGVEYAQAPASALPAPDFDAELVDGTAIRSTDLWAARPWLFVFTASYCDRCREIHRAAAEAVADTNGAVALLGIAGTDDGDAAQYAEELDLGHPLAVASERVWLNYAAREPGLVVLVGRGGKVVRGWPGGATASELEPALARLVER